MVHVIVGVWRELVATQLDVKESPLSEASQDKASRIFTRRLRKWKLPVTLHGQGNYYRLHNQVFGTLHPHVTSLLSPIWLTIHLGGIADTLFSVWLSTTLPLMNKFKDELTWKRVFLARSRAAAMAASIIFIFLIMNRFSTPKALQLQREVNETCSYHRTRCPLD